MKSYKQIITGTIILLFGLSSFQFAHAESETDDNGVYWVKYTNSDKTTCSIYHGNSEGLSTKGVRRDHLALLRSSPGKAGDLADLFITRYFGEETDSDDNEDTSELGIKSFRKPITRRCSTLEILKDALNKKIKQKKIPLKPADLVCYSPSKKMKYVFRVNTEGQIDWTLFSNINGTFKSWGKSKNVILDPSNESEDEDCQIMIRNLSTNLKICLPSEPSESGKIFERKLVSLKVDGFTIPNSQTMRCKASTKFYKSVAFTSAQKISQKLAEESLTEEDGEYNLTPDEEQMVPASEPSYDDPDYQVPDIHNT